jgi:hypothetical protein
MAEIKRKLRGMSIEFTWAPGSGVRVNYSAIAYVDEPGVAVEAVSRPVSGDLQLTLTQFRALIDGGSTAFEAAVKSYIDAKIPDTFGAGHTITEDNS